MAAWFVFLHFFLVPLCRYAVSERQMLLFFAGGLVGIDKHLSQRVSLITSMTLPLNYIFVAKLKDSTSCFITRWRVFYKCVQLVQGEIMLISITIFLLFNFVKKHLIRLSVSSKLSYRKLVSPQFLLFTLFCLREKNRVNTLQLTSKNFVYMQLPDLRRIARIAMARCTREAKFEAVQRHYKAFPDCARKILK